ncbi:MAG: fasciclin domain-containing protein [Planctomycetota bacterium]|nr:fasciclin domain-containing protein [Planctomycetota bacterium]MDA0920323.1 fasciclin domain-containing protein [Planctomycetota bacterium]
MLMNRRTILGLTLAGLVLTLSGTVRAGEKKDIVETAVAAGQFKTLAAALQAADLVDALKGKGPFTVFAPTDEAFAKLPKGTVEELLKPKSKDALTGILTYHVVAGSVQAADVVKLSNATTLNGQRVDIAVKDGGVMVDGAKVVVTDIKCSNGVIHVIDSVILPASANIPATAVKAGTFKMLVAAAKAAGLVEALSGDKPLTVFAPSDEAFARLPEGTVASLLKPENIGQLKQILLSHVVEGRVYSDQALKLKEAPTLAGSKLKISASKKGAFINKSKLTALDIEASNGVIHVIDAVLMPPAKKVSKADAKDAIHHAVSRGTALYNAGHTDACARHYMATAISLLDSDHEMPAHAVRHLQTAMQHAKATNCSDAQSWTMRRGLDGAYRVMMADIR